MNELEIVSFVPKSTTDWPGKTASVIGVPGCNLRCGYCFSVPLVLSPDSLVRIPVSKVLDQIASLKPEVNAVVVSGGEPTLSGGRLMLFLEACQKMGLRTRIETNGTNPFVLKSLIAEDLIDSIVLDLKAPLYSEKYFRATNHKKIVPAIKKSMLLIENAGVDYEYRIVVVPQFQTDRDIFSMVKQFPTAKRLSLHQFVPYRGTIDAAFSGFPKTEYEQLLSLGQRIEKMCPGIREIRIKTEKGEETVNRVKDSKVRLF